MIWKDINNIEGIPDGKYEVSDEGCVRRKGCRCVKPFHNRRYLSVKLTHFGVEKTVTVHRLVASAFIPNPEHKREVNHIDANPENNRVTNLEWATKDENMRHAASLHLMKGQKFGASVLAHPVAAYTLEGDYLISFSSGSEAMYVLSRGHRMNSGKIIAACKGKRETAYGFQWRYIDPSKGVETKIAVANMTTNRRAQVEREDKDTFRSALLSYIAEKRQSDTYSKELKQTHIAYVECEGDPRQNLDALHTLINIMHDAGAGYFSFNHKIDTCTNCGYNGIIGDVCPSCGQKETPSHPFVRPRRITGSNVGPFTPRGVSNKKVNCWDTLTGNAEGNQQPSHAFDRTPAHGRFIDYPAREYPTSEGEALWLRNESMKQSVHCRNAVSGLGRETWRYVTSTVEQNLGVYNIKTDLSYENRFNSAKTAELNARVTHA